MSDINFSTFARQYRSELLDRVIPFWEEHSIDREQGGFFTCLLRDGSVFDTDKFIWLQGRQIWTFAMLYRQLAPRPEWLAIAEHGADFLLQHGRAQDGSWYFSLDRSGQALVAPYNIFSDCFAAQAFGQLYLASGREAYAELARTTFAAIQARQQNPKGKWSKAIPDTRPMKNFALPMILCNLAMEIAPLLAPRLVQSLTENCVKEVMEVFYQADSGLIYENVATDGRLVDSFEGRLLNPGHAIEAMWFVMDIAAAKGDTATLEKAKNITLHTLEYAWDETYGGLYYFLDAKGYPPQQLEWDQKLWWVHLETLIALLKAYKHTQDPACLTWFKKVHDYTWAHFTDAEYGEWYGYLNRQGEVLLPLKGGKWKGCYHVPRGLYQCWQVLEELAAQAPPNKAR